MLQIDADCDAYNEDMLLADKDKYLAADHLPALQYFISWQFWYNVHHDPTVYSVRIINDDDLTKMKLLVNSEKTDERIKVKLANVIEFCSRRGNVHGLFLNQNIIYFQYNYERTLFSVCNTVLNG